jgi:hypothetical protein
LAKDQKEGKPEDGEQSTEDGHDDKDFADLLQELRILLQGVQVMTAFLVILPFSQGFKDIDEIEKWVFLATFICSLAGLILFSAPAAVHRLARPLTDRTRFKDFATRMTIVGLAPASLSLVLATQLVVEHVLGGAISYIAAGVVLVLIAVLWWVLPLALREKI